MGGSSCADLTFSDERYVGSGVWVEGNKTLEAGKRI